MQATELRIGNLFKERHSGKIIVVLELLRNGAIVFDFETSNEWQADPVPLTKEWLVRLGFEKNDKGNFFVLLHPPKNSPYPRDGYGRDIHNVEIIDFKYRATGESYDCYMFKWGQFVHASPCNYVILKHVHQLQNLVFALTGKELECR